jgi:hypothetical protein
MRKNPPARSDNSSQVEDGNIPENPKGTGLGLDRTTANFNKLDQRANDKVNTATHGDDPKDQ